ncbi:MAG: SPW repeat protein [Firmicutes bacterium]|nr:SPW repeat protein [Bacillota bacterium]
MWQGWVNLVLGIYLAVSPWIVGFSTQAAAMWNNLIVGIVVAILAYWGQTEAQKQSQK